MIDVYHLRTQVRELAEETGGAAWAQCAALPDDVLAAVLERFDIELLTAEVILDFAASRESGIGRTSATKSRGRPPTDRIRRLDDAIVAYLAEQHPSTVRGVFYGMSVRGQVEKSDAGYRCVQRRVLALRQSGQLDWTLIADGTRWMRRPDVHGSLQDMLSDSHALYRRDFWREQAEAVELWVEKDALADVVYAATSEWAVPLMVSRGFSSASYLYASAQALKSLGKPVHVYLLTDYDYAGLTIDTKIREGLREHAPGAEIHFHRLALAREQVEEWHLPTRAPKPRDLQQGMTYCCELDAIPPRQLIELVEAAITQHIDERAFRATLKAEAAERASLAMVAGHWARAVAAARAA